MSSENRNKRLNNEESKNVFFGVHKVSVISSSSNTESLREDTLVPRNDKSKVIIKVKKSPIKSVFLNKFSNKSNDAEMKNDSFKDLSTEQKASLPQKLYDSILVSFFLIYISI